MLLGDPQAQLPAPLLLAYPLLATLPTPLPSQTLSDPLVGTAMLPPSCGQVPFPLNLTDMGLPQ